MIRPKNYQYFKALKYHLQEDLSKIFKGKLVYPRQFEIHLPSNHKQSCNLACEHCQGHFFQKDLGTWEMTCLSLLNKLKGIIPYHIYGGAYTEPLMNPYLMTFLHTSKYYGNHFGIHTNGTYLWMLQEMQGWLNELNRIVTNSEDYLSISLDAGTIESHKRNKRTKRDYFTNILKGVEYLAKIRKSITIRICYLLNETNNSEKDISSIIAFARKTKVDSLRFSIPYAWYAQSFEEVRRYKRRVEEARNKAYYERVKPYLSQSQSEKPYIFYISPQEGWTDIDLYDFKQCIYGYYQITYGADGFVYRCSAVATPTMKHLRLGKITDDLNEFNKMILANQNPDFDCVEQCFDRKARGNRMAVEINRKYRDWKEKKTI